MTIAEIESKLDEKQVKVFEKFSKSSWLSKKTNMLKMFCWVTFYRRNIHKFIEDYFGITLYLYQIFWLYCLNTFSTVAIIAGRASAKSYMIAIFSCAKCVLYPNTKIVIVSGSKTQASIIVKEKIKDDLYLKSLNLQREILDIKANGNDTEIIFVNGSKITVVASNDGARGHRSTMLIFEEFVLLKKHFVDKVMRPMQVARECEYNKDKFYEKYKYLVEEPIGIYISSSFFSSHWANDFTFGLAQEFVSKNTSCVLATDYSIALKHNIKTRANLTADKRQSDPISWRQEYENEIIKENTDAYFPYELLKRRQVVKNAWYPRRDIDIISNIENTYIPKKKNEEIRTLNCDMAFSSKSGNDNSAFSILSLFPENTKYKSGEVDVKKGYRRSEKYMITYRGEDVDEQAIKIKQLFYDFDCDYLVLDGRNGGRQLYHRLAKETYDKYRDITYPAWKCMNDKLLADEVYSLDAIECVFVIQASQKLNSDIAQIFKSSLNNGMIDLLQPYKAALDELLSIQEYINGDEEDILFYERPFIETDALINETSMLMYEKCKQTGAIKVYEIGSNTKDRYTSISYGNYFASMLERDFLSSSNNNEFAILVN